MHETYTPLTLGEFIDSLEALGDQAQVRGLNGDIRSYRGYYERNATAPCDLVHHADFLAKDREARKAAPEHAALALKPDRTSFLMTGLCPRCRAQLQFKIGRQQCQAIRGAQRQPPCMQPVVFVIAFDT